MSQPFMRRIPPFSPTQISGCQLWLDAADSATISFSSGTSVSQWNDKSGANNHALQATTANQPSTYTSANGLTGMNFGTSNFFRGSFSSPITGTTLSAFVILNMNASTYNYGRALSLSTSNNNDYIGGAGGTNIARNAGNVALWAEAFGGSGIAGPFSINTSTNYIVDSMFDGTTHIAYLNGSNVASVATSSSFSIYLFGIGFQAYQLVSSGADYWIGYINEVIVYNTALTEAQRQNIESYLAQKWGLKGNLPNGHPGFTSVLYPSSRVQSLTPMTYAFTFTPTGVAGCALWLDANDINGNGTTPSNGSTVTTWVDKSGNGRNGSSTGSPTITSGEILFSGSQRLSGSISNTTANLTAFVVAKITINPAAYASRILSASAGGLDYDNTASMDVLVYDDSSNLLTSFRNFIRLSTVTTTQNQTFLAVTRTNATTNTLYLNGTASTTVTLSGGAVGSFGYTIYWIGGGPSGNYITGTVSEALYYHADLTDTQRQQIEGYLAWKWGIQGSLPSGHPYKSVSPNITNPYNITRNPILTNIYPTVKTTGGSVYTYPSYTITNGLISYFLFDNTLADARSAITLSQTGSISYVTGLRGQAVYLPNEANISASTFSSNYLTSTYTFPSTFTVSLWFRTASSSPASAIFNTNRNPTYVQGSITLYYAGGNLYVAYTSVQNNGAGYAIAANTWYNAVVTYNSGTTYLYVNGSQSGSAVNLTPVVINQGFMLGGSADNGPVYPFAGYIEDFRIYNRVLSGSEITAIYNGTG